MFKFSGFSVKKNVYARIRPSPSKFSICSEQCARDESESVCLRCLPLIFFNGGEWKVCDFLKIKSFWIVIVNGEASNVPIIQIDGYNFNRLHIKGGRRRRRLWPQSANVMDLFIYIYIWGSTYCIYIVAIGLRYTVLQIIINSLKGSKIIQLNLCRSVAKRTWNYWNSQFAKILHKTRG